MLRVLHQQTLHFAEFVDETGPCLSDLLWSAAENWYGFTLHCLALIALAALDDINKTMSHSINSATCQMQNCALAGQHL